MKEEKKNYYQEEKAKKEFLIFDRGLTELTLPNTEEKKLRKKVDWFLLYKILFKNILSSKEIIPIEELNLRFSIIRTSLPKYYKGYKGTDSNSTAIIKKFTYHICKNKRRSKTQFKIGIKAEKKSKIINSVSKSPRGRSSSMRKSRTIKADKISRSSPNKKKIVSVDSIKFKNINVNNNLTTENGKEDKLNINEIRLGTPTDAEFPLNLSQKRNYNTKPSFFYESLSKIKELTKQEKIKTFQKEFTSQILKFNDLYFDPKIDDFSNDKLFNDVKSTCDLFINRFQIDSDEEKNLADLDNYI